MFKTITSTIHRHTLPGHEPTYFAGKKILPRIAKVRYIHGRLGERKLEVTRTNGDFFTVVQPDRGYFEIRGPHIDGIEVKGWVDAVQLIDSL
jgi:hypothetical protein